MTLRLPETVYRAALKMARREGVSVNKLVARALAEKATRSTARRLKAAYEILGQDAAEADVERFVGMQAEALLDG